jgi:hypothetical protein
VHTIFRAAWILDPVTQSPVKIGRWVNVDAAKPEYLTATGYRTR